MHFHFSFTAKIGNIYVMQDLLSYEGAEVDVVNRHHWTPLHVAIREGKNEMVQFLIENGADIKRITAFKWACTHLAALSTNNQLLYTLINAGGKELLDSTERSGKTPMIVAYSCGNTDTMKLLLELGAHSDGKYKGSSLLHSAVAKPSLESIKEIISPENINERGFHSCTPLHIAVLKATSVSNGQNEEAFSRLEIVQFLLENNADINAQDEQGQTPLHYAAAKSHFDTVQCLIKYKANVNVCDNKGMTPLYVAIQRKSANNIKTLLLDSNTDLTLTDRDNKSTVLHLAVHKNDIYLVKTLLQYKAEHGIVDKNGNLPLHIAAAKGNKAIARMLIKANNSTKTTKNANGETPGDVAAKSGKHQLISVLGSLSYEVAADYEIKTKGIKKVHLKNSERKLATGVATGDHFAKSRRRKDKPRKLKGGEKKNFDI